MKSKLILCAEGIAVDQQTNNATAYSILEEISAVALPSAYAQFFILSLVERDDDDPEAIDVQLRVSLGSTHNSRARHDVGFSGQKEGSKCHWTWRNATPGAW